MSEAVESAQLDGEALPRSLEGVRVRNTAVRRLRFVKAYWTTFVVIASYIGFRLRARFAGRGYYESRISKIHQRNAERIERRIVDLQGLFIKVGQLISIMSNFLPEEFRRPLEALQDRVPPRPLKEIRARIREELGAGPETLFASFEEIPLASASLGQVHRARLGDGTEVVVKVQHRDIEEVVRRDLRTIWRIMVIVSWFVPIRGLDLIYRQVREMVEAEVDFVREAAFMDRIRANIPADEGVTVPRLHSRYCTARVLTSSYSDGAKVTDRARLDAWGVDRGKLAERLVRAYCRMIFVDGIYHADPHPGNVLVERDGTVVLLDFGAVAELSPSMRRGIADFLEAVIRRDTTAIHRALRSMGFIAHGREADQVSERIVEYFHRRFQDEVRLESLNLKDIRIDPQRGLEKLVDLRRQDIGLRELTSSFQVPKDWVLLERTLLLMSGVCTELDPEMNPMAVIRPYLEESVFGPERDFATLVVDAIKDTAMSALAVPDDVRKYLSKAMRGDLEMEFRGLQESASLMYALGHQIIYALFAVSAGALAVVFWSRQYWDGCWIATSVAGFFGLCLLGSMWSARRWRRSA